jgi:hypothetical protein
LQELLVDDLELGTLFLTKLQLAGIPNDMTDSYPDVGYHLRVCRHFHVQEGFPSIITTDIPDAVSEVKYKVDISGCLDFETDEETLLKSF